MKYERNCERTLQEGLQIIQLLIMFIDRPENDLAQQDQIQRAKTFMRINLATEVAVRELADYGIQP